MFADGAGLRPATQTNVNKKTTIFDGCRSVRNVLAQNGNTFCLGLNQTGRDKKFAVFF